MSSSKARGESKKHGSFKLASTQRALQQPASGVGRAPEEQSRRRDNHAIVRGSDSERDRIKRFMSEAWTGEALNRTRRQLSGTQLEHREHDDSQRRRQQDRDSV